jgi:site-specific DNA recombinase
MSSTQRPRVALYARFSTDLQRQSSIADQVVAARDRAQREGWPITIERSDEGVSGAVPVGLRAGGKALLADALAGRFDILIVEGLDRLSRDVGEQDQVVKRLEYRGIRLIGTSDGYDTLAKGRKVMRVARGLVNELYLDDLRDKTHRGLAGQFSRGLSAGGKSYGYTTVDAGGGRRMVIDEAEAEHVRWIFRQAADGRSIRAIVHELNQRGVASPRGGTWAVSALQGSSSKGLGLLNNELYIGRVIWNRRQWLKDPETGSRRYVERPRTEWQTREQPELRIVDDDLWRATRAARSAVTRIGKGASPKTLFGGLLRCMACSGPFVAITGTQYGCSVSRDRGETVCANRLTFSRTAVDRRLLAQVRDELLEPSVIAELHTRLRATIARRQKATAEDAPRKRLAAVHGEISRLVDAVAAAGYSEALGARLKAAEAERDQLTDSLAVVKMATCVDVDTLAGGYRSKLMQLETALLGDDDRVHTRKILADLLGPITLGQEEETGAAYAELDEPAERLLFAAAGGVSGSGCGGKI